MPVGMLMPSIVDLVHRGPIAVNEARHWHLSRVGEAWLDAAASLHDNAIRDGDLLLLTTTATPSPVLIEGETWHTVSAAAHTGHMPPRATAAAASVCAALLGAAALVWSGTIVHATGQVVTGGALAGAAAVGAVAMRRANADPILCATLSVIAVVFAAATGSLAVPGSLSTANALLAAAVACMMSTLLLRVTRCGAICLTSVATFSALTCVTSACSVAWTLPTTTTGAVLSVLSLGTLGFAAKVSIAAAGLTPALSSSNERAVAAHHTLTGLVVGSSGATVLGAVFVAMGSDDRPWPPGAIFAAVVGLVMVLRARTHIDAHRRIALVVGGIATISSGTALVVVSAPEQANWIALVVTAIGVGFLGGLFGATVNPLARRAVDVVEYLSLVTVAPLACWAAGLYGIIRGLSLP